MLVLSRKVGEQIRVPECKLVLTVLKISGGRVRIGFAAPTEISVVREELWRRPSEGRANAAAAVRDMEKSTATR